MSKRAGFQMRGAMLLGVSMLTAAGVAATPSGAAEETDSQSATLDHGSNVAIGIGLVVGLPGTGDSDVDDAFVERTIVGLLEGAGVDPWRGQIKPGGVAKVLIMGKLPANAGDPLSVSVTAIGNAASLAGGTLLPTPLRDDSGKVHAVAQGPVTMREQVAKVEIRPPQAAAGPRDGGPDAGRLRKLAAE